MSEDMPGTIFLEYVGERKVVRQLGWVQDQMVAATGLRGRKRCVVLRERREQARATTDSSGVVD